MSELSILSRSVADLLTERRQTVCVSESAAGGLISAALLAIPGASAYFVGGAVVYTREARRGLLRMTAAESKQRGSTEDYALAAARALRTRLGTTWAIGESGASGPAGNRYGDASGHACFAVTGPIERCMTVETDDDDRESNMWAFAKAGLDLLEETLLSFGDMIVVYGIGSCDTCHAATKWLDAHKVAYRFHDFDSQGLDAGTLNMWISEHGWEALLNRRSTTWRNLPEPIRQTLSPVSAAALMLAHPKLIKRPVIDFAEHCTIGFSDEVRSAIEQMRL